MPPRKRRRTSGFSESELQTAHDVLRSLRDTVESEGGEEGASDFVQMLGMLETIGERLEGPKV